MQQVRALGQTVMFTGHWLRSYSVPLKQLLLEQLEVQVWKWFASPVRGQQNTREGGSMLHPSKGLWMKSNGRVVMQLFVCIILGSDVCKYSLF